MDQQNTTSPIIAAVPVPANGVYAAHTIEDVMAWGVGGIKPLPQYADPAQQTSLVQAVLANIVPVTQQETSYSLCTDGRSPKELQDGAPVPIREQLVGADTMTAFFMAEVLADHFYKDANAPVAERLQEVVDFLVANGLKPSTHSHCGAAAALVTIGQNVAKFAQDPAYQARQKRLLPEHVYDEALHAELVQRYAQRYNDPTLFASYGPELVTADVAKASGDHGIAHLRDGDHVEELIVRLRVPGVAIDEAGVAAATGGREVFGVNDTRLEKLASLFGRGQDEDYRLAYMAGEDFTDAGHGTLAHGLPTIVIERQA